MYSSVILEVAKQTRKGLKMRVEINFKSETWELFPLVNTWAADLVAKFRGQVPALGQWFDKRAEHHRELAYFCLNDKFRKTLVTEILNFMIEQEGWERDRDLGGSDEYRNWLRNIRPHMLQTIWSFANCPHELWMAIHLVSKSIPELSLRAPLNGFEVRRMQEMYERFLAGSYQQVWWFKDVPDPTK